VVKNARDPSPWHLRDMPADSENVYSSEWKRSHRLAVRMVRSTRSWHWP